MATLVARQHLLPGVAKKLIGSSLCKSMESKDPIKIFMSPKKQKKVLPWQHLLPGVNQRTNPLQSAQGYGKQRTHKNIYKSKKQNKVLPWQRCCQLLLLS